MPKQYVAMRNAFKAEGLSDKKAKAKAAAIYNSKHKDNPVTRNEDVLMTRLTRQDIAKIVEATRIERRVPATSSQDAEEKEANIVRVDKQVSNQFETPTLQRKTSAGSGRVWHTPASLAKAKGYSIGENTYYSTLKSLCEAWWCGTTQEGLVKTGRNVTSKNLLRIADVLDKLEDPRTKLVATGARAQSNLLKTEDTMTGDIGSIAMPFVAPGGDDPEEKKRRKRRKLATIMAGATGSVQGTGN